MEDDSEETLVFSGMPSMVWPSALFVPLNGTFEKMVADFKIPAKLGRLGAAGNTPNFVGFNSKVVSRSHAEVFEADGNLFIRDLGSAAGTFLNGNRLSNPSTESQRHLINPNDIIQLGTDYTPDQAQLTADPTLKGVRFRMVFRPPSSGIQIHAPVQGDVDLNNLTVIVSQTKEPYKGGATGGMVPRSSSNSSGSIEIPQYVAKDFSKVMKPPSGDAIVPSFPLSTGSKSSPEPLPRQSPLSPSGSVSNLTRSESQGSGGLKIKARETYIISTTHVKNKLNRVQVQLKNKDLFELNVAAWENGRKLLIQDHKCQFSKSPYVEVLPNGTNSFLFKPQMGGGTIAMLEQSGSNQAVLKLEGSPLVLVGNGDFVNRYIVRMDQEEVATGKCDVLNQPNGASSIIDRKSVV